VLEGRVALITGSAKRLGRSIALALTERGCKVSIHYRFSKKEAEETAEMVRERGGEFLLVRGNLEEVEDCKRIVDVTFEHFERLDFLVNNASIYKKTPLFEIDEKDWDAFLVTNLRAAFFTSQRAAIYMRRGNGGKIVNISDWAGVKPYKDYLPYCVSKGALITLTKALAKELAPDILVNAVAPGPILLPEGLSEEERSEVLKKTPLKRTGSPRDIANSVRFLLEDGDFVTGSLLVVDGGRLIA